MMDYRPAPVRFSQCLLSYVISALLASQPLLPAFAVNLTPTGATQMDNAGNGVPVVNIAPPNAAGLSHNTFTDYNVGTQGLILNNATGQLNPTQLGGLIQNNPNLKAGQEAHGIINEVTGANRSQLQGYTEVAGKAANVMVANPYGITCNGCGFINTPQATLTTGKPLFDANGNLQALEVKQGSITVEGRGLDASQSDALSLISRAAEINAGIHAKALNITAGANRVAADGGISPIAGEGLTPAVAVDTGALGGMYAGRIRLVSSENGMGVNLGNLNARQGDIQLEANGQLRLNNSLAHGELKINGAGVTLTGDHKASGAAQVSSRQDLTLQNGNLVSDAAVSLSADNRLALNQAAIASGQTVRLQGQQLFVDNASRVDAAEAIAISARDSLSTQGQLYAGQNLTLRANSVVNSGTLSAGGGLAAETSTLFNTGAIQGASLSLSGDTLVNQSSGLLLAEQPLTLKASRLLNQGSMAADTVLVTSQTLENQGLIQGSHHLGLNSDNLTLGTGSRVLTDGALTLNAVDMFSDGQLQGRDIAVTTNRWQHTGSLLATNTFNAGIADALLNNGDLLSQGAASITVERLTNSGSLLSAGDMRLTGGALDNNGKVQGDTLTLQAERINNQGSLTGLKALNLDARLAMAAPLRELINGQNASLLSAGGLTVQAQTVRNDGLIQAQNLLLNAQSLDHRGAAQSADLLQLNIARTLDAGAGSKITALGEAAIKALTITNRGQWLANNLTLRGETLNNAGEIGGVNGLDIALTDAFSQQAGAKALTGGALKLKAAAINNAGAIQGQTATLSGSEMANSGVIQGTHLLGLGFASAVQNEAAGTLLSEGALTLSAPMLRNDGLIQGGEATRLSIDSLLYNGGRLLSSGSLSLNAAEVNNAGWLQAPSLGLHAGQLLNTGTLLAAQQATLAGDRFVNTGKAQADTLAVDYQHFTNGGVALGASQLEVTANQVNLLAEGKLFSGGGLQLTSVRLDPLGQIAALGNLTLRLATALTTKNLIAAGGTLSFYSEGALENQSVMQGQAIALSTGGQFTNSGQLTTGNGDSAITAQNIALNASGTVQAGGNISFTSLSDILVNGFTGTTGSLTLNAAGTLFNTALIYAADNLFLLANRIHNQRGDILAGNSLWMQRDMAGNASAEVVNTSGAIETQNGDITINTAHLLNTRDGLRFSERSENLPTIPGAGKSFWEIDIDDLPEDEKGVRKEVHRYCNDNDSSCTRTVYFYAPPVSQLTKKIALSRTINEASSDGVAARIAAGRNLNLYAGTLDNFGSVLLAAQDAWLTGDVMNNHAWQNSVTTNYLIYTYKFISTNIATDTVANMWEDLNNPDSTSVAPIKPILTYLLVGPTTETATGTALRAVIQAGGAIFADFASNLSNTSVTAFTASEGNTLNAPALSPLSQQDIDGAVEQQGLQAVNGITVTGANDRDWPLPSGQNGYFVTTPDPTSPYLFVTNPKLDNLGQLDPSLFGDLYALLGMEPGSAPRETRSQWTQEKNVIGSAWFMARLGLNPERDYRFLGDAAFDTRYVSNALLNQTGSRYLHGFGSDLEQMRYLMDNAAAAQQSLGLAFGVSLTATQIAALDHSILWWEAVTVNGQKVMAPKLYLAAKDAAPGNGSVIAGNNVRLASGEIVNSSGTMAAKNGLYLDSLGGISNLNSGLMQAGGGLNLSAFGDINNIGSVISGRTVALESFSGSINNITQANRLDLTSGKISLTQTQVGPMASIQATDSLWLDAAQDITLTGANLIAGDNLDLYAGGDVHIGALAMTQSLDRTGVRGVKNISDATVAWQGSSIRAGNHLDMAAGHDLTLRASDAQAGGSAQLAAGNDLNLTAEQTISRERVGKKETHTAGLDRTTVAAGSNLTLLADQDIHAQAAALAAENNVGMQAGRDVNLNAEATTAGDSSRTKKKTTVNESVRQQGTEIASGGDTVIIAGRDMNAQAAQVTAQGDIGVAAGRDINLTTATESDYAYREKTSSKSGFLSKKTTHTIAEDSATREKGSLLSGDNVSVSAGNNLLVQGSAVAGDGNVALSAGNNVDIVAATNTDTAWRFKETKKSGLSGTGGLGFTLGSSKTTHDLREQGTTQSESFSTVGSTGGNVSITAGNQARIGGADLIAGQNLSVTGDSVLITPGHDKRTRDEKFEQKSSGLTVALSGAAGSAINNAVTTAQSAKQSSDSRLAALQGAQAALSGVQAGQAVALDQVKGSSDRDNNNTLGVNASLGSQSSVSSSHMQSDTTAGSTLSAGNNVTINATGGDITVAGSQIKAGKDVTLDAARDVNLIASQDTRQTTGKNSSSGGSIGVGVGVGSGGAGVSISANANSSKGREKGNGVRQNETTVDAGNRVTLSTGRDATLAGAQVSGNSVAADIGRDLTIASTQDSDHYSSKQNSVSGSVGYTFGPAGTASAGISASRDKITSDYDSVQEQSGIFAGSGGFDVTVGNHTQLNGGVLASTATADQNRLDTGTLGFRDIRNQADFETEHQGAGLSTGGSIGGQFTGNMANGLLAGGGNSGHAQGTTQAAVSGGSLIIRDQANQTQDVTGLSRDAAQANGSISPIFDKEKEQQRLREVQLAGELGSQAADIARTQGEINGLEKAKERYPGLSAEALRETDVYKAEMQKYGTGSDLQRGIQAATAALQGLAGSDLAAALAGASAPELAYLIGHGAGMDDSAAAKTLAHAILGGAVAALQGNNAAAGAAGGAAGELAAKAIAGMLYPEVRDLSTLGEEQKQTLSTLATISAGMAGGLAGGGTGSALAGGQAGKNAVENNLLNGSEDDHAAWLRQHGIDMASCSDNPSGAACQKAKNERNAVGLAMATGSVALLPGGAQALWGLGAGANAGINYLTDGTIDPTTAIIGGWVNVISAGNGVVGTVGWNAAGGAAGNWLEGKDSTSGALVNGVGSFAGYGIGKGLSWSINTGANWWKGGWDPKFNADLRQFTEVKGDYGLSKEMKPSNVPSSIGDIGGSIASEAGGKYTEYKMKQEGDSK